MKVLVDMNLSPGWAEFLSQNGYESVHWQVIGGENGPDTELVSCA